MPNSASARTNWKDECIRLENEVEKLKLLVDEINELTLIKKGDEKFSLVDDAMYCAQKYWYDNNKENASQELQELDIYTVILHK